MTGDRHNLSATPHRRRPEQSRRSASKVASVNEQSFGLRYDIRGDVARGLHIVDEAGGFADPHAGLVGPPFCAAET